MERTLGQELRQRREAAGKSRREVAEAAGYTRETSIANIEQGYQGVSVDVFARIADAIGIPSDEWADIQRLPVKAEEPEPEPAAAPDPTPAAA